MNWQEAFDVYCAFNMQIRQYCISNASTENLKLYHIYHPNYLDATQFQMYFEELALTEQLFWIDVWRRGYRAALNETMAAVSKAPKIDKDSADGKKLIMLYEQTLDIESQHDFV